MKIAIVIWLLLAPSSGFQFAFCQEKEEPTQNIEDLGEPSITYRWALDNYFGRNGVEIDKEYGESLLVRLADSKYEEAELFLATLYAGKSGQYKKLEGRWERYCEIKINSKKYDDAYGMAFVVLLRPEISIETKKKAWLTCSYLAEMGSEKALIFVASLLSAPENIQDYGFDSFISPDFDKAELYAQEVLKTNPGEGNYLMGLVSIAKKHYSESYVYLERAAFCGNFIALQLAILQIELNTGVVNSKTRELYFRYLAVGLDNSGDSKWSDENRVKIDRLESLFTTSGVEKIKNEANSALDKMRASLKPTPTVGHEKTNQDQGYSSGTGFICTQEGHVLTAAHVIDEAKQIKVLFKNKPYEAEILSIDEGNDVALLKLNATGIYPFLSFSEKQPNQGTKVSTYGFPNPDIEGFNDVKYSSGEISSLRGLGNNLKVMRLNLQAAPGNSGGPLLDIDNRVIGILIQKMNSIKMLEETGDLTTGVSYAVKNDYVLPLLKNNKVALDRNKTINAKNVSEAIVLILSQ